jgi:hypothetical protein
MTTFSAELLSGKIFGVAVGGRSGPVSFRICGEFLGNRILRLTLGAFHPLSPQEAGGNAISEEILPSVKGAGRKRGASYMVMRHRKRRPFYSLP